ncbi:MAG: molybdopterin-dependent oxidoreductase [Rubrivivax sp.]|nr:molybdopterin-dependent oxidoreductase [Rubrivivax sp.]
MNTVSLDRRQFLASASAFTLGFSLMGRDAAAATDARVNSWLSVDSTNAITLTVGASDMGQGSVQGLAQVLAEDLMVNPTRVRIVQGGPTLASPAPLGAAINTVGSGVTRGNFWRLRDAGAIARETLVMAAMQSAGDGQRGNFTVADGVVRHHSGVQWTYGQLAPLAATLTPPASAALVPDSQLRWIGQPLERQDIPSKVDGSARYGLDVRLPGQLFAVVRHCPTVGGVLASVPPKPAAAVALVPLTVAAGTGRGADLAGNRNAFAVVATTTWDAMQLALAVRPKWTVPAQAAQWSSAQFAAQAQALLKTATPYVAGGTNPAGTLYTVEASTASPDAALARADVRRFDATYTLPYVPHGCLEVLNCTVDYVAGQRCDVYAPTQSARGALQMVMALTGLPESAVRIHTTMLGGGLGRKAEQDFVAQAVQLGMVLQRPVQLVYPREEDFTHDQYRPMGAVRVQAALDPTQAVAGWIYRNVSPSILGQRGAVLSARGDSQGYEASNALPYAFGARRVEWVSHPSPVPVGFWRSVGASINTFAVESAINELARLAGQDALAFRRARITDPRWLAVLDAVAAASAWSTPPRSGSARGVAIGTAFNTIVAMVVEVSGSSVSNFKVTKVWLAADSYLTVNPRNVEAQLMGGVVHAINATLYGQQTFNKGAAQRKNFNTNPVIRLKQMPQVSVNLIPRPLTLDRNQVIGGIGELGVPTFAPALAGALLRLTGKAVRSLPIFPNATMGD